MPRGRLVDGAQERQVVARVEQQPQIGQHVAVFLAVEEGQALDDLERHALLDEGRFQAARQGVDAQEDGEVAVAALARVDRLADAPGDPLGLVQAGLEGAAPCTGWPAGLSVTRSFGLRCLLWAIRWLGRAQDRLGAAVVLRPA